MATVVHPSGSFTFPHPVMDKSEMHPIVKTFMNMGRDDMIERYCLNHNFEKPEELQKLFVYQPKYLMWGGADLFPCISKDGARNMVLLEVNSCPAGQKHMPHGMDEDTGYHRMIQNTFLRSVRHSCHPSLTNASLAVIYDKNYVEVTCYAAALANLTKEPVFLVEYHQSDAEEHRIVRWTNGIMEVKDKSGIWHMVRAAFRYVTQKPWNRIPLSTKTMIFNPVVCCLGGGRNKLVAAQAYADFNESLAGTGLKINTPRTYTRVQKQQIPDLVNLLGGRAVIKVPYSNCGQTVYAVTSKKELDVLMCTDLDYEKCIVQAMIGHQNWSSSNWHHACTVPNAEGDRYIYDTRMVIHSTQDGFKPICLFSRRARKPLPKSVDGISNSWEYIGTNLCTRDEAESTWQYDRERGITVNEKKFELLGLGLVDLIDGYIQTVMAIIAIDKMCSRLMSDGQTFDVNEFSRLTDDSVILAEVMSGQQKS